MNEAFTWAFLGSAAGISAATVVMTQIVKRFIPKVDPKWIALAISFVISMAAQAATGDGQATSYALALFNAVLTAGAAIGAYEGILGPLAHVGNTKNKDGGDSHGGN